MANPVTLVDVNSIPAGNFQASPTITVQAAAYAAGASMGGLITASLGASGLIDAIRLKSTGGATNGVWIYAWSKTPSATITDKATYVPSASDSPYALPGFPAFGTFGNAPGTWDTGTTVQISGLTANFRNQDTTPGQSVYFAIVTSAAVTPGSTSDLSMVVGGIKD